MMDFGALQQPLLYALAALAAATNVALAGLLWRRFDGEMASRAADAPRADLEPTGDEPPVDDPETAAVVSCPTCGTANEGGYRYCRACVSELPGPDGRATALGSGWNGTLL